MRKRKAFLNIPHFNNNQNVGMNGKDWNYNEDGEMVTICCGVGCEAESDVCSQCGEHSELTPTEDYEK